MLAIFEKLVLLKTGLIVNLYARLIDKLYNFWSNFVRVRLIFRRSLPLLLARKVKIIEVNYSSTANLPFHFHNFFFIQLFTFRFCVLSQALEQKLTFLLILMVVERSTNFFYQRFHRVIQSAKIYFNRRLLYFSVERNF